MEKQDLVIIGAGPAGLTAALYAGRSRLKTVLIEKLSVGGKILTSETIENYPGFPGGISTAELMGRMESQVKELDVQFVSDDVREIDCQTMEVKTSSESYRAGAVIVATGSAPRKLNVPGEKELTGRGVSYCATCDAPFFKGKSVLIVGGGNAVAEEALYLCRFARSVNIVHRRQDLRASQIMQERMLANEKIKFILSSVVTRINGSQKVSSVTIKDLISGIEDDFVYDGVFVYIGHEPATGFLRDKLKTDEAGYILTDENMATSVPGIFACGDCRKKGFYQVINACGDGAIAADSAYKFISAAQGKK